MKKIILIGTSALTMLFVAYSSYGFDSNKKYSDLTLSNIEILSNNDVPADGGICYSSGFVIPLFRYIECLSCETVTGIGTGDSGICSPR